MVIAIPWWRSPLPGPRSPPAPAGLFQEQVVLAVVNYQRSFLHAMHLDETMAVKAPACPVQLRILRRFFPPCSSHIFFEEEPALPSVTRVRRVHGKSLKNLFMFSGGYPMPVSTPDLDFEPSFRARIRCVALRDELHSGAGVVDDLLDLQLSASIYRRSRRSPGTSAGSSCSPFPSSSRYSLTGSSWAEWTGDFHLPPPPWPCPDLVDSKAGAPAGEELLTYFFCLSLRIPKVSKGTWKSR